MSLLFFYNFNNFCKVLAIFIFLFLLTINSSAQDKPLTLADVTTGLQSKSSGKSMAEKNRLIKQWVEESGITFTMTDDIKVELRSAGASSELLAALASAKVFKPSGSITKIWTERNYEKEGVKGLLIHFSFEIGNRKGQYSHATVWLYDGQEKIIQKSKYFTPSYDQSSFSDYSILIPYKDITISQGVSHTLKIIVEIHTDKEVSLAHQTLDYTMCLYCQ